MFDNADSKQAHINRERQKARELRKSRWWQNQVVTATCYYCQKPLERGTVTMDHLVPLSCGGRSTRSNIVPACKDCNSRKHARNPVEWLLEADVSV